MPPRRFRGRETEQLVGMTQQAIYKAQREGRLPPPDLDQNGRRLRPRHQQILEMQNYFDTSPHCTDEEEAVVLSFTNFKGGCWKTTTSWYAGSYYAMRGFRVLFIDVDPQASLTTNCGLMPDIDTSHEQSIGPYIMEEEGFPGEWIANAVRDTHLENMKIIPSTLALAGVEYDLTNTIVEARESGSIDRLLGCFHKIRDVIQVLKKDYDIIIMDGTPSLGLLPLNIVFASDTVIVPVPTESNDFASTLTFCDLYHESGSTILNHFGDDIALPKMLYLPTRFSASEKNATSGSSMVLSQIRATFGEDCLDEVIRKHEAVVSNLTLMRRTAFDINASDAGLKTETLNRATSNFSAVFDEILDKAVFPHWPSRGSHHEV